MSLNVTLIVLAAAAVVFAAANYLGRRPRELGKLNYIPYTGLQFVALVVMIIMLAHLVTLWTGVPLQGRLSR